MARMQGFRKGAQGTPRALLNKPGAKGDAEAAAIARELEEKYPDLPGPNVKTPSPENTEALIKALGIDFSKMGYKPRPAFAPKGETPYDVIQQLASLGLSQRQVHLTLGWSEGIWNGRKAEDPRIMECYELGFNRGIAMIANRHFTAAMQGSIPAMQFILKTKGGFQEPKEDKASPQEMAEMIKAFLGGISSTTGKAPEPSAE